jgi:hypothetical protein
VPGTLTITTPVLRIVIDDARRQIHTPNPVFTAHYEGFLNGDGPSIIQGLNLTTTATIDSTARKYPIFSSTTPGTRPGCRSTSRTATTPTGCC